MKLGIESFTVLDDSYQDFRGTLQKISDMGFQYIEWLNSYKHATVQDPGLGNGMSPQEAVKTFADYGITLVGGIFTSSHAEMETELFDMDKIQRRIDWYGEAGCKTLGVAEDYFQNSEFFKKRLDAYNEIGRRCKQAGLSFMYHNHYHEWQLIDGEPIFPQLIARTDPDLVGFDYDVYWGLRGLVNPVKFIEMLGSRIKSMHAKDFPFERLDVINAAQQHLDPNVPLTFKEDYMNFVFPEDFTECGTGVIKWQEVIDAGNKVGIPYIFVEQDHTKYPTKYECLEASKQYLLTLNGLSL